MREEVELIRWPDQEQRREELRSAGAPRLLVLGPDAPPPVVDDPLEDWVRSPCPPIDLRARTATLLARWHEHAHVVPELDTDGVLRFGDGWVSLPPVEARLTAALVDGFRAVVTRTALTAAGWPGASPRRNALDVHMLRLRRRLEPVDLAIRTIRGRGYLLEPTR